MDRAWVRKLLFLEPGELSRLLPFFLLYFLLFSALVLADGFSLALFLEEMSREKLPLAYGMVGAANLLVMAAYIRLAERFGSVRTFQCILGGTGLTFALCWLALGPFEVRGWWPSVLFAGREIAFTLVLMHFGTFLNDFFSRVELNRVLPIVYSGGRLGGILGGLLLERLARPLGLLNLIGLSLALIALGMVAIAWLASHEKRVFHEDDEAGDPGVVPPRGGDREAEARRSTAGFLGYVWASPLLFWVTVSTLLFVLCRWFLNYQYTSFFDQDFEDKVALARFLGLYSQIALAGSLVLQLLVVNRLVAWIGIKGAYLIYTSLMVAGTGLTLAPMTLGTAIFARLVETELRFGLRNPIMQLITNKFSKAIRVRVRAWSFGVVVPLATLAASALLGLLVQANAGAVAWGAGVCGVLYFVSSFGLLGSFRETTNLTRRPM